MTRMVLIGRGRRLTLDELRGVCCGDDKLEMHVAAPPPSAVIADGGNYGSSSEEFDVSAALDKMSLEESLLSPSATLSALTLLSLTISQGRVIRRSSAGKDSSSDVSFDVASALVAVVNHAKATGAELRLPSDPAAFGRALSHLLGPHCPPDAFLAESQCAKPYLRRGLLLSRLGLSLSCARSLSSRGVADALAALSAERLSGASFSESFATSQFDELRPHRGCIESAAVLRACLQGSASTSRKGATPGEGEGVRAVRMTPQYHGPSREAIANACRTMELEINCSEPDGAAAWDDAIAALAASAALGGVRQLLLGSTLRAGGSLGPSAEMNEAQTLEDIAPILETTVASLQGALEKESKIAHQFIQSELSKKEAELKAKEAEKAKRAAERAGATSGATSTNDEFAGMTEAQKAKILKKRAEKEAKAAAKRKAKEAKAAGGEAALTALFGAGTASIYPLLPLDLSKLTNFEKLDVAVDALLSGGMQRKPKVPKGTRDYLPEQMNIRDRAFQIIRRVFKRHGAVEIDTPVFELKETLTGKYGEDSKLIYDLADQGGELLALRYDLTVPFARFLAVNAVGNIKRFHIGKVYRRDQPALSRGRYREFYQCDFDIAGIYGRMVPDSECLAVVCEILDSLPIGNFGVKLNHRRLLDAILDLCGVPADKFRTICSAVDKLDKEPWSEVKREMVEEKGLASEVADRIGEFVVLSGKPWELYHSLMNAKKFGKHKGAAEAMEDLRILFQYLETMDKLKFITFDLSLARGLDYYTGVIYEAVCMNGNTQVGSIGGGGRYDNLVSMFQEAGKVTPCVGVSVGIERVFTLMEERLREEQGGSIKQPNVTVLVASAGENLLLERMKLTKLLWDSNISAEFSQQENPKLKYEISNALERDIPFMVIAGEAEAKEGKCKVKDLKQRTEETVDIGDLVTVLRTKGVVPVGCEFAMEILNEKS